MTAPARALLLAIDTATSRAVVALGHADGTPVAEETWAAGHRHGEELLVRLQALLARADARLSDVTGIVAGTGPGAFTGLRVGLATAKALAHTLDVPIVGVSSADALRDAARASDPGVESVLLPAGPSDRVLIARGEARLLPGSTPDADLGPIDGLVAVDLDERAPPAAAERGRRAQAGMGAALLRLGAGRLGAGERDDLARLVPEYVTLPRGVREQPPEVAWSRGHR